MHAHQAAFFRLALAHGALRFGEFTLKSGRKSPYFFNLGQISSGRALAEVARIYVHALEQSGIEFDLLFGPAYKGIPLAAAVAMALADGGRDVPFAYDRKEAKAHGEGGRLVGAPVDGRVVIVDDVLTAGTALSGAVHRLRDAGATPVAAIVALDRQEPGPGGGSAVVEMAETLRLKIVAVATAGDLADFLDGEGGDPGAATAVRDHLARSGVH